MEEGRTGGNGVNNCGKDGDLLSAQNVGGGEVVAECFPLEMGMGKTFPLCDYEYVVIKCLQNHENVFYN